MSFKQAHNLARRVGPLEPKFCKLFHHSYKAKQQFSETNVLREVSIRKNGIVEREIEDTVVQYIFLFCLSFVHHWVCVSLYHSIFQT